MTPPLTVSKFRPPALAAGALLLLPACAAAAEGTNHPGASAAAAFPYTTENCGYEVTFDHPPERLILLETAPVTILDAIGVMDRVVARAGEFPPEYYSEDLTQRIHQVPSLSEDLDATGHLMLSQEEVVAQEPHLALGLPDGIAREGLDDAGINLLEQELYCPSPEVAASYETLYMEIDRYGRIFGETESAGRLIAELRARVAEVEKATPEGEDRTAAVLYPSVGGGPVYAYGSGSMAQPQLEAAGFENVFAESEERVFEVQTEELVNRDPDLLILLYQGDPAGVKEAVVSLPGAETITAVETDEVLVQLFNYTEPASPLSVEGLEIIAEEFHD